MIFVFFHTTVDEKKKGNRPFRLTPSARKSRTVGVLRKSSLEFFSVAVPDGYDVCRRRVEDVRTREKCRRTPFFRFLEPPPPGNFRASNICFRLFSTRRDGTKFSSESQLSVRSYYSLRIRRQPRTRASEPHDRRTVFYFSPPSDPNSVVLGAATPYVYSRP